MFPLRGHERKGWRSHGLGLAIRGLESLFGKGRGASSWAVFKDWGKSAGGIYLNQQLELDIEKNRIGTVRGTLRLYKRKELKEQIELKIQSGCDRPIRVTRRKGWDYFYTVA